MSNQYWKTKEVGLNFKPGEDRTIKGTAYVDSGSGYVIADIIGIDIVFKVWDDFGVEVAKWNKEVGTGITIVDGANGRYNIDFADTEVIESDIGTYTYRITFTVDTEVKHPVSGSLTVGY